MGEVELVLFDASGGKGHKLVGVCRISAPHLLVAHSQVDCTLHACSSTTNGTTLISTNIIGSVSLELATHFEGDLPAPQEQTRQNAHPEHHELKVQEEESSLSTELVPRTPPRPTVDKPASMSSFGHALAFSSPQKEDASHKFPNQRHKEPEPLEPDMAGNILESDLLGYSSSSSSSISEPFQHASKPPLLSTAPHQASSPTDYLRDQVCHLLDAYDSDSFLSTSSISLPDGGELDDDVVIEALNGRLGKEYVGSKRTHKKDLVEVREPPIISEKDRKAVNQKDRMKKTQYDSGKKERLKKQPQGKPPLPHSTNFSIPSPVKGGTCTATCHFFIRISHGSHFDINIGDARQFVHGIYLSTRLFSPRSSPLQTSPQWLNPLLTATPHTTNHAAQERCVSFDFSHTLPLTLSPSFVNTYTNVPLIVEVRHTLRRSSLTPESISLSPPVPSDGLLGLLKLPFYHLVSTWQTTCTKTITPQPLIIPETEYGVVSPISGNVVGRIACFMALGTADHVKVIAERLRKEQVDEVKMIGLVHKQEEEKQEEEDEDEEEMSLDPIESIPHKQRAPRVRSKVQTTPQVQIHTQTQTQTQLDADSHEPHHLGEPIIPSSTSPHSSSSTIRVSLHRACGLKYLLQHKLNTDQHLTSAHLAQLEYSLTVGPSSFATFTLLPLLEVEPGRGEDKAPERESSSVVPESFTPQFDHSLVIKMKHISRSVPGDDRGGLGMGVGHLWHYMGSSSSYSSFLNNDTRYIEKRMLLGTFRIPLETWCPRGQVRNRWIPIFPHPESIQWNEMNNTVGAAILVSLEVYSPPSATLSEKAYIEERVETMHRAGKEKPKSKLKSWKVQMSINILKIHVPLSLEALGAGGPGPETGVFVKVPDSEHPQMWLQSPLIQCGLNLTSRNDDTLAQTDPKGESHVKDKTHDYPLDMLPPLHRVIEVDAQLHYNFEVGVHSEEVRRWRDLPFPVQVYSERQVGGTGGKTVAYHGTSYIDVSDAVRKVMQVHRWEAMVNEEQEGERVAGWYPVINPQSESLVGTQVYVQCDMKLLSDVPRPRLPTHTGTYTSARPSQTYHTPYVENTVPFTIRVKSAMHLPLVPLPHPIEEGDHVSPNAVATFEWRTQRRDFSDTQDIRGYTHSPVVVYQQTSVCHASTEPRWDDQFEVQYTTVSDHGSQDIGWHEFRDCAPIKFKVWHEWTREQQRRFFWPDKELERTTVGERKLLGTACVDMSPLASGLHQLNGWYTLHDECAQVVGEVHIVIRATHQGTDPLLPAERERIRDNVYNVRSHRTPAYRTGSEIQSVYRQVEEALGKPHMYPRSYPPRLSKLRTGISSDVTCQTVLTDHVTMNLSDISQFTGTFGESKSSEKNKPDLKEAMDDLIKLQHRLKQRLEGTLESIQDDKENRPPLAPVTSEVPVEMEESQRCSPASADSGEKDNGMVPEVQMREDKNQVDSGYVDATINCSQAACSLPLSSSMSEIPSATQGIMSTASMSQPHNCQSVNERLPGSHHNEQFDLEGEERGLKRVDSRLQSDRETESAIIPVAEVSISNTKADEESDRTQTPDQYEHLVPGTNPQVYIISFVGFL
jgi:hypothetical protein